MHYQQVVLGIVNLLGGTAVLASYLRELWIHPATRGDIWGGVPPTLKPLYTVGMLLAAAGYFAFTYFILFRLDPDRVQIAGRFGFAAFPILYAFILFSSALWMPLTFAMLEHPSGFLWWAIRATLAIVGLASLCLLAALLTVEPAEPRMAYWFAVAGSAAFCVQTAIMDALVWPAFFRL